MNSVLITGGAGFLGSHLAERIINNEEYKNYNVIILDNLVRTNSLKNIEHLLSNPKLKFHHTDISTCNFEDFVDPFTVLWVFHLAATRINRCNDKPLEGHKYIADGGVKLIDWVSKYNIKFFFASSASVYQKPKELPIKESINCLPHTIYGSGKLYCENILRSYHELFGLEYVINRFFSIYGIRMDSSGPYTEILWNFFNQIKKGKKDIFLYGNPDEKVLDLVYVDDVVDAVLLTMKNSKNDIFNVSTQTGITLTNLVDLMEEITDTKLNRIILNEERKDIELKRIGDVSKLRKLGWEYKISLKEGLEKTWQWIKNL